MMPTYRRFAFVCALFACGAALSLACARAGVTPAPSNPEPTPAVTPADSTPAAASAPSTPAPEATASAPTSAEPTPPCVDGDVVMGTCICREKGKTPDATGHCVYPPCPKILGGTAFRDETTGQCMECRAGLKRTKDGGCAR